MKYSKNNICVQTTVNNTLFITSLLDVLDQSNEKIVTVAMVNSVRHIDIVTINHIIVPLLCFEHYNIKCLNY